MKFVVRGATTRRRLGLILTVLVGLTLITGTVAIHLQSGANVPVSNTSNRPTQGLPLVSVVPARRADLSNALVLSVEFRPFQEVNIHAKVTGYVRQMKVDVGDRVKAGAVLAVLEIPELDSELQRASAGVERANQEVVRAKAAYDEAHLTYERMSEVLKQQPNLVAQQEIDQARARNETLRASWVAAQSAVREAIANQAKYTTMVGYSRIIAPFAGVVTKRYADTGSLVGAGTESGSQALIQLSQLDPLRLVLPVPESAVPKIHAGDVVEVLVPTTKQTLSATVTRVSGEVATETRTMHVEVDVPNPRLNLAPGMYASAALTYESRKQALSIPVAAVPDRRGSAATVLVLNKQHTIEERKISVGMETPTEIEVTAGLDENDLVVLGGQGRYQPGQSAEPKIVARGNPQ